jgi:energy-converting hydrogenase Eha subunit A
MLISNTTILVAVMAAIGAILTALIAAFVSLLGLIISKEQKVSEFRQSWIDSLREDTASLISHADVMFAKTSGGNLPDAADLLAVNEASTRIKLRLNPTESESKAVLKALAQHETRFSIRDAGKALSAEQLIAIENELTEAMQKVLKREWKRVRSGEAIYRSARSGAILMTAMSVLALLACGVVVWRMVFHGHF